MIKNITLGVFVLFFLESCNSELWTIEKINTKCKGHFMTEFDASQRPDSLIELDPIEIKYLHSRNMYLRSNRFAFYSLIKGMPNSFVIRVENSDTVWYKLLQLDGKDLKEVFTLSLFSKQKDTIQNSEFLKTNFRSRYFQNNMKYFITETLDNSIPFSKLLFIDSCKKEIKESLTLNCTIKRDSIFYINESDIAGKYIRVRFLRTKYLNYYWDNNKKTTDSIYYVSRNGLIHISKKSFCSEMDTAKSVFFLVNDSLGIYRHITRNDTALIKTNKNGYIRYSKDIIKVYGANGGPNYADSDDLITETNLKLDVLKGIFLDNTNNLIMGKKLNHFLIKEIRDGNEFGYLLSFTKQGKLISLIEVNHRIFMNGHSYRDYEIVPSNNSELKLKITDSWAMHEPNLEGHSEGIVIIRENGEIEKNIYKESTKKY